MHPILRNILAVIAGAISGGILNMALVTIGPNIIPLPEGADNSTMEGLAESMPLFEFQHFIFPFLAHALGTLLGAMITARIAASHHQKLAWVIGGLFLIGGIQMVMQLPSPMWFNVVDLGLAYIPMAWIGGKIGQRKASS